MRSRTNRKIAGVCAGFAEYFDLDVTLVRVVWLIVALFGGGGVLAYIIAWIVMPEEPEYVGRRAARECAAVSGVVTQTGTDLSRSPLPSKTFQHGDTDGTADRCLLNVPCLRG